VIRLEIGLVSLDRQSPGGSQLPRQGILTEGEGSVQLTSLLR